MKINRIVGEECKAARSLWEEVFYEDSLQFTDYYFENKAGKNIGYVIGKKPYDAMMFRTPYMVQIGVTQKELSYLVGVATRKECRHRGYMRELLMHSFKEMYDEKQPFTFLMPANPDIYEPFDFQYVYEREVWEFKEPEKMVSFLQDVAEENLTSQSEISAAEGYLNKDRQEKHNLDGLYSVQNMCRQMPKYPILENLAAFANKYLEKHYNVYVHRDAQYYEIQLKESLAQNGDIYVLFKQGEINAFFLYAKEGEEIFLQEVMEKEEGMLPFLQKIEKKKPIIMARIIHLEAMMKLIRSSQKRSMIVQIEDELIPENAGIYRWDITPKGSKVFKLQFPVGRGNEEKAELKAAEGKTLEADVCMHIRDFVTQYLKGVFINEIV